MDNLEKVYNEVAQEMGLSKTEVKSIAESQFSFVAHTMRAKEMDDVRLQYFGTFKVKPKRLQYLPDARKQEIKDKTDEFDKFL